MMTNIKRQSNSTKDNSLRPGPRTRPPTAILCNQGCEKDHRRQFCATRTARATTDGNSVQPGPQKRSP
eukprot:10210095-Karenia_brevis.AAC.1